MKVSRVTLLAVIVTLFTLIQIPFLNLPFIRQWETVSARNACVARNLVKFGYTEPGIGLIHSPGGDYKDYPTEEKYNVSRLALPPVVLSLWFHLFGINEASFRICLFVIAIITILIFDLLAGKLLGDPYSLVATVIFTFNPLVIYYSLVNPEIAFTMPFVLLAILQYCKWIEHSKSKNLLTTLAAIFFACNSDWFGYSIALILTIHLVFFVKKNRWFALTFIGMNLLSFGLHIFRAYLLDPTYGTFLKTLLRRSQVAITNIHESQSVLGYLTNEAREALIYFTPFILILTLIGIITLFKKLDKMILLLPLLAFDEYLFLDMGTVHDFYMYEFMPFIAIASAAGISSLFNLKKIIIKFATALLLTGTIIWYSYVSYARLVRSDKDFFWKMGVTIQEETRANDKILVCSNTSGINLIGFYSDRHLTFFYKHADTIHKLDNFPKTIEDALNIANAKRINYAVIATVDSAREIDYFKRVPLNEDLINFFALEKDDKILQVLRKKSDKEWQKNGFVFFRLKNE